MEQKYKRYLKLNLISLVFIGISFISITLAWFAYSGLAKVDTEIAVKAWYIEFEKDGQKEESNDIVISLNDVYPGMSPVSETVDIKNMGDSLAQIKYSVTSVRVLNDSLESHGYNEDKLEDILSHDYPFHVNINLSKEFAIEKTGESRFTVSVSWPLDSGDNITDSQWGNDSYLFQQEEQRKWESDNSYQKQSPLKIVIHLTAEQYIESNESVDYNYPLGQPILFDVSTNKRCYSLSDTCIKTYVIDSSNKIGDSTVRLLPNLFRTYTETTFDNYDSGVLDIASSWNVPRESIKPLLASHLLNAISTDIVNSELIREGLSPLVIGDLKYTGRLDAELEKAKLAGGYYKFINSSFEYLSTSRCYWTKTEYDSLNAFALVNIDDTYSRIYNEEKTTTCNVVPIINASKVDLINTNG